MAEPRTQSRALKAPLLWMAAVLLLTGIPVQVTGVGIDLFALLFAGSLLFAVERTLGDAVAEFMGPRGAAVLFCAIALAGIGYMLTQTGQSQAKRVLAVAQSRGYQPLYFAKDPSDDDKEKDKNKDKDKDQRVPPPREAAPTPDVALAGQAPSRAVPPPAGTTAKSADAGRSEIVAPGLFSHFMSGDVPLARLIVTPNVVSAGEPVRLELRFIGTPVALKGPIAFLVNGREIARVEPDSNGVIAARATEAIPGTYEASARLPGGTRATAPGPVSFMVLPPRR